MKKYDKNGMIKPYNKLSEEISAIGIVLSSVCIAAFIYIFLKGFVFDSIPAFSWEMYVAGKIIEYFSYAYLGSFLFYIVVDYLPRRKRKITLYIGISDKYSDLHKKLIGFMQNINNGWPPNITANDVATICSRINPNEKVEYEFGATKLTFDSWWILFDYVHSDMKNFLLLAMPLSECLPERVLVSLMKMENLLDNKINIARGHALTNSNICFCSYSLFLFFSELMVLTKTNYEYRMIREEARKAQIKEQENRAEKSSANKES